MKIIGVLFLTAGIALLIFVGYSFLTENEKVHTPVPEEKGVKVIFVTPTQ